LALLTLKQILFGAAKLRQLIFRFSISVINHASFFESVII